MAQYYGLFHKNEILSQLLLVRGEKTCPRLYKFLVN